MNDYLKLLYYDNQIVVVDKPGGFLSVPGRGPDKQDCIVARVKERFPSCIAQPAVHRLDMATSGVMVLALTKEGHKSLSHQFSCRRVVKRYEAILEGAVQGDSGLIKLSFRLDPENRPYQVYDQEQGKEGLTSWRVLQRRGQMTRVEFFPHTGRTHQLRLHASHFKGLHCPIKGDALYGSGHDGDKMYLHATGLQITHPESGQHLCFFSSPDF